LKEIYKINLYLSIYIQFKSLYVVGVAEIIHKEFTMKTAKATLTLNRAVLRATQVVVSVIMVIIH